MTLSQAAEREARRIVPDTCPAIDAAASVARGGFVHALDEVVDAAKVQTTALREALIDAIEARLQAEVERDEARAEVEQLQREIDEVTR